MPLKPNYTYSFDVYDGHRGIRIFEETCDFFSLEQILTSTHFKSFWDIWDRGGYVNLTVVVEASLIKQHAYQLSVVFTEDKACSIGERKEIFCIIDMRQPHTESLSKEFTAKEVNELNDYRLSIRAIQIRNILKAKEMCKTPIFISVGSLDKDELIEKIMSDAPVAGYEAPVEVSIDDLPEMTSVYPTIKHLIITTPDLNRDVTVLNDVINKRRDHGQSSIIIVDGYHINKDTEDVTKGISGYTWLYPLQHDYLKIIDYTKVSRKFKPGVNG